MEPRLNVWSGLWWGPILSALVSAAAVVFFTVTTGQGREWAPMTAVLISVVALPLTTLLSSWVLFVRWKSRLLPFGGSFAVQSVLVIAVMLYVHGYGKVHRAGELMLAPFFLLGSFIGAHVVLASMVWCLLMVGIVIAARTKILRAQASTPA